MELGCRTFPYRAAIAWNSLSDKIRYFSNPVAFQNRLKLLKIDINRDSDRVQGCDFALLAKNRTRSHYFKFSAL
jgi:hypothetical protein